MNASTQPDPDDTAAEERHLRELFRTAAPEYIDDAGFTARVVGRLPASRRRQQRRRWWLLGAAAVLGAALAAPAAGGPLYDLGAKGWTLLAAWSAQAVPFLNGAVSLGALVVLVAASAVGWWAHAQE